MSEKIAIIDLGTNTFHLLIAEKDGPTTRLLHREKQPVKIGLGGINRGVITDEATGRAMACLRNFKLTLDQWKVSRVIAFGTSALRDAKNGKDVIQKIKQEAGIDVRLITGDEEAEYIYFGVRSALDLGMEKSLIVDIGGGSVEFIIGNHSDIFWKQSFDIGAQRLLEQFQKHDPILPEEIKLLDEHFAKVLLPLQEPFMKFKPTTIVGSSGTFDTLSEIYCLHEGIHITEDQRETPLTIESFYETHRTLISKSRAERLRIPGMIEMRVDMIVVASCLISFLLLNYSLKKIRVSSYSLKEGVLEKI